MTIKDILLVAVPPLSALAGVAINEFFNIQRNKNSLLLPELMKKKLGLYSKLYDLLAEFKSQATKAFEKALKKGITNLEKKRLVEDISEAVLETARFIDKNAFFLDEYCTMHILLTMIGPSNLLEIDVNKKGYQSKVKELQEDLNNDYMDAIDLLQEYSGLSRVNKSIFKINKPKTETKYMKYLKEAQARYTR